MSSSPQDLSSTEKNHNNSALPSTDASEIFKNNEGKSPAQLQASGPDDKARFLELRNGLAGWQWSLFHLIVFFGAAISGYDVSNVSTIQLSIYQAFGRIDLLPWIVTAFSLGVSATSPTIDRIMKLVDLKWFTLSCWTVFIVATAVCGASPTIEGIIVGRIILGVAGGGCYLSLLSYSTILARPTEHARLTGLLGMGYAVGLFLGPVIGGSFAQNKHATWRWAFYIGIPYSGIIMVLICFVFPNVRLRPQEEIGKGLLQIDWVGAFLHAATLTLFDAACIFSGSTLSWRSGVIALWVMFGVVTIVYTIQQAFSLFTDPAKRILPIGVLSTRTGFLVMSASFCACSGYGPCTCSPYIGVYIAGAIGCGMLLPVVRRYAVLYLLGGILIAAGAGSMMSVNANTSLSQTMGISAILGFGVGLTMQLGVTVLALALPANIRMDNSITMTLTIYTGTTVSLAIAGCIFQNIGFGFLSDALQGSNLSNSQIHNALAGHESPVWAMLDPEALDDAISAVTKAIIRLFYISTVGGALMAIFALIMKWEALDFKHTKAETERGSQQAS
ncbi:major facilitator superfamily transporter [Penicillium frequentans]|uniref:Major facilitator superfamily transporter n=1 Tax=Penicillium frequentans TaxID=3151616 RepID=A0AAD6D4T4_9EURO|nr:major facilitator superfamily transporter [Penicillium glabrum]